ncbi:hypothetical protein BG006_008244 [Podila minutissima]|uniref:Uncharacterized protein n=1 Tax=Podila minutissima TaxID=64525 RepID=A0A9P5SRB9_9FUNG|nr:hypothetical protein BG006_008243 [Podila minutissima]KAF9336562.1 hypothetical protein BG006_008244 [Podila minutissima]
MLCPSDLWRLCQVSQTMHIAVLQALSNVQRFKYETARILHQEHALEASLDRQPTLYDRLTFEASTASRRIYQSRTKRDSPQRSSLANQTTGDRIQNRGEYWTEQALFLVGAMSAGTPYEPKTDRPQDNEGVQDHRKPNEITRDPLHHFEEDQDQDQEVVTLPSSSSSLTSLSSAFLSTEAYDSSSTTTHNKILETDGKLEPLIMSRFQSMVDLIFDPSLVQLGYRRAIINSARYVSSNIDDTFPKAADVNRPTELYDPVLYTEFQKMCTIKLGPYLSMLTPFQLDDGGLELSMREQELLERVASDTIEPPKRLANYFHMMLWHRCMHDLIAIYNRIQQQHTRIAPRKKKDVPLRNVVEPPVCCQDTPSPPSTTQASTDSSSFPFCCNAHSLVFTSRYPTSVIPYSVRLRFRRAAHKVQVVSQHAMWLIAMGGIHRTGGISNLQMDRMPPGQRVIRNVGCNNKIQFCNGSVRPPMLTHPSPNLGIVHPLDEIQQRLLQRRIEDEAMLQRRHLIEERMKQDNLIKQELLGLCHMACGLFLITSPMSRPADAPPTIMSLLRYGSPWNKGVWREGEWRHDPIELGHSSGGDGKTSNMNGSSKNGQENLLDQGPWQKMCIAAIQFLAHEDLAWGGTKTNAELSRLRATSNANAWVYHE